MLLFRACVPRALSQSASTTALIVCFLFASLSPPAAHESWISRGKFRNTANEWCCGDIDCVVIPAQRVHPNGVGYDLILDRTETVPYSEALPSQDGQYWRCHRPDGTRRCFFAPQPSM